MAVYVLNCAVTILQSNEALLETENCKSKGINRSIKIAKSLI